MKKSKCAKPSAHYKELQSRVQGLNAFRQKQNFQVLPNLSPDAGPGGAPGSGHGSDAKALTRNAVEDFALAPILGLDRREVAGSSFVYGTEEQYFHQALTILHSLQRLRRRQLLSTAQLSESASAAAAEEAPSTPRSSAFTWDLVDAPLDDGPMFEGEDDRALADIPEEQGDAAAEADSLDSLQEQFSEAVSSLEGLDTPVAKNRASRLRARFALLAHDVAQGEVAKGFLTEIGKVCKVKHNHKPPSVPGGGVGDEQDGERAVASSKSVADADYSPEQQLSKHLQKCITEGRKQKSEWKPKDSRCGAFWQLTMLGRAKLLSLLVEQLSTTTLPQGGSDDSAGSDGRRLVSPLQQRQQQKVARKAPPRQRAQQRVQQRMVRNRCDSGSSSSDCSESPPDFSGSGSDSDEGRPQPAPPKKAESELKLTPEELLAVLARGLESVECPEKREHVLIVAKALLSVVGAEALMSPGAKLWIPRLSAEERADLSRSLPNAWSHPMFVAIELRLTAYPPRPGASASELQQWADTIVSIWKRAQEPRDDTEKLLMSELRVYSLHHALLALERAAWLQQCSAAPADKAGAPGAPVAHVSTAPVTVPKEMLHAYLHAWRPLGSGGFVPDLPAGSKKQLTRNPSVCRAAAECLWSGSSVPAPRRRPAVLPADDEQLAARLVTALVTAQGPACAQDFKINDQWLQRVLAEATLTSATSSAGPTQSELQAYAKAKVNLVELTERIEVEFEPCNRESFSTGERAEVFVRAKNCGVLAIRVFEVDAWRYYVANGKEVPSDLSLEGLEPNVEVHLSELQQMPPLKRSFLRLHLPFIERGGVFVLELIGNGVSCRALLHVGALHLAELQRDAASQTFAVYDSTWRRLENVTWLVDGNEQESTDGTVVIPHVNDPSAAGRWTKAVVRSGGICTLFECLRYSVDKCELRGGFFVDEEQLQEGSTSVAAICRVQLFRDQDAVSLALLKSTEMRVWWQFDGSSSYQLGDRREISLSDEADHVAKLEVPRGARMLKLDLEATLASGAKVSLAPSSFTVHGVAEQCSTDDFHLCPGFELQALGRSGEPVAGRLVEIQLQTALTSTVLGPFKCRTDADGKVPLGKLHGVVLVKATFSCKSPHGPNSTTREWTMTPRHHSATADTARSDQIVLCAAGGEAIIPVHDSVIYVLEEVRLDSMAIVQDLSHLATLLSGGSLHFSGLPPGRLCRLRLWYPDGTSTMRLLLNAEQLTSDGRFAAVEEASLFEWRPEDVPPYFVRSELVDGGKSVRLQVTGAKPGARVHLVARRFWRPMGLTAVGAKVPLRLPSRRFPAKASASAFLRTRRVGDIIRYVLERRPLASHPEFSAPSLPAPCTAPFPATCVHGGRVGETNWAVRGDAAGEVVEQRQQEAKERPPPSLYYEPKAPKSFATANVAFVEPSEVIANIALNNKGCADVKLEEAGVINHAFYEVLLVQPNAQVSIVLARDTTTSERPHNRDMRLLREVLDPARHYGEVYGSRVLKPGEVFELTTPSVSRMQVYNCLPQIFDALLALLNRSSALKHFEYLKRWPELDEATKLSHYSKDACHELHLFLLAHDRPFFERCIAPLLANRRRYGRLDRWLLGLPPETEPALGPLLSGRLEQLLLAAQLPEGERQQRLSSLLRLAEEDAANEQAGITLQRRTKAYDVMLQPHAAQLEPESAAHKPKPKAAAGRGAYGMGNRIRGRGNFQANKARHMEDCWDQLELSDCESINLEQKKCKRAVRPRRAASVCSRSASSCEENDPFDFMQEEQQSNQVQLSAMNINCLSVQASTETGAWFSKPAARVAERLWLTPTGLSTKGAALWREVARTLLEQKGVKWPKDFVSSAALEACLHGGVSEAIVALSLLSLPFTPEDASSGLTTKDGSQVRRVSSNSRAAVVFFSMVQEVEAPTESSPLLLTQELKTIAGNPLSRSSELMVNTVITAQVLVVNCGAQVRELRLLLQCPEGAIPVGTGSFYTRSVDVEVPAFGSTTVQNYFYFPSPGSFRWFPAHALSEEKLVAFEGVSAPLKVVNARGAVDAASWRDVAARGSLTDVMAFLRRPAAEGGPPDADELSGIAWRMRDPEAYKTIITELRLQLRYSQPLWGYGFMHGDLEAVRELLVMDSSFKRLVGPRMESALLSTEALDGSVYSHCDFEGLVLSRAHTVGVQRQNIEDADLREAYQKFLQELAYAAAPSLEDRVLLTNFMLMQDRVDEARVAFEPVKEVLAPRLAGAQPLMQGPLQLQAAYHMAYLDLIGGGNLMDAKLALKAFGDAPWLTTTWRDRFSALGRAVQAASGLPGAASASTDGAAAGEGGAAAAEAELDIEEVDPKRHGISLKRKRLRSGSCHLACYVVDVELTFSASPFAGSGSGENSKDNASHITAIAPTVSVPLADAPAGDDQKDWVPLPESVRRRQMVLEVVGACDDGTGRRLSACRPCYFCDAEVAFDERAGTLKVAEAGKPALGTYVKVFAASGQGSPKFYKDGYTDVLGVFDYVSLNAKKARLGSDSRLAVLVVTKDHGALVRVLPPPPIYSAPAEPDAVACAPVLPQEWACNTSDSSPPSFSDTEGCYEEE